MLIQQHNAITLSPFRTIYKFTNTNIYVYYAITYFKIINSNNEPVVFYNTMTENTTFSYNNDNNKVYLNNIMFEQNQEYNVYWGNSMDLMNMNSSQQKLLGINTETGYLSIETIENEETHVYTFSPVKFSLNDGK